MPAARSPVQFVVDPVTGCWIWQRAHDEKGYGWVWDKVQKRVRAAHIVFYESKYGPVPDGMVLDHVVCDCRSCVNPDHVKPSTWRDNFLRGQSVQAIAHRTNTCLRGHSLTGDNEILRKDGRRRCRICSSEGRRRRYERTKQGPDSL